MQPVQHVFTLGGGEGVKLRSATGGNEEEGVPHVCAHIDDLLQQRRSFVNIAARQGGIDLQSEAASHHMWSQCQRRIECSGEAAERIMGGGGGAVKGHRHGLCPSLPQRGNALGSEFRGH